ncbi:hypothetical protein MNBD_BACTEROID05-1252 [hydrothermal vent metagenome]|uniref:Uncharacterized protein n=1 Tax=hydrothermal vent metagenome TaxID=652676 RepID=A0A3B0TZT8_9ZZZZ
MNNHYTVLGIAVVSCLFFFSGFLEVNKALKLLPHFGTIDTWSVRHTKTKMTAGFVLLLADLIIFVFW